MKMNMPPHPKALLVEYMSEHKITTKQLSAELMIDEAKLLSVIEGKSDISNELSLHIESALGISSRLLLKMQDTYKQSVG